MNRTCRFPSSWIMVVRPCAEGSLIAETCWYAPCVFAPAWSICRTVLSDLGSGMSRACPYRGSSLPETQVSQAGDPAPYAMSNALLIYSRTPNQGFSRNVQDLGYTMHVHNFPLPPNDPRLKPGFTAPWSLVVHEGEDDTLVKKDGKCSFTTTRGQIAHHIPSGCSTSSSDRP